MSVIKPGGQNIYIDLTFSIIFNYLKKLHFFKVKNVSYSKIKTWIPVNNVTSLSSVDLKHLSERSMLLFVPLFPASTAHARSLRSYLGLDMFRVWPTDDRTHQPSSSVTSSHSVYMFYELRVSESSATTKSSWSVRNVFLGCPVLIIHPFYLFHCHLYSIYCFLSVLNVLMNIINCF